MIALGWLLKPLSSILAKIGLNVAGVTGILATIGGLWIAYKAFMATVLYVILPTILYKVYLVHAENMMGWIMQYMQNSDMPPLTIEITGMGGWIANEIMLPQCFSVFMAFLTISFVLRFVPGFK